MPTFRFSPAHLSLAAVRRGAVRLSVSVAAVTVLCQPLASQAADLIVWVGNIQQDAGQVMVGIFDTAEAFPKTVSKGAFVPAKERDASGRVRVVVSGLLPGQYAASVFHDIDGNGKLNSNLMGLPTEPYGFSNDARGTFGPPSFKEAAFSMGDQDITLQVQVK